MDPELYEALQKAALETVVVLLRDPDPRVRLDTAMSILQGGIAYDEVAYAGGDQYPTQADVNDMAELDEFPDEGYEVSLADIDPELIEQAMAQAQATHGLAAVPETAMVPATEENMEEIERKLAAAQVGADAPVETMPPGFRSGNSGIGSGTGRQTRRQSKKKHGRR